MPTVYDTGPTQAKLPNARNMAHVLANAKTIDRSSCPTTTSLNILEKKKQKKWSTRQGALNILQDKHVVTKDIQHNRNTSSYGAQT